MTRFGGPKMSSEVAIASGVGLDRGRDQGGEHETGKEGSKQRCRGPCECRSAAKLLEAPMDRGSRDGTAALIGVGTPLSDRSFREVDAIRADAPCRE